MQNVSKVIGLLLEIEGKEVRAYPLSPEERQDLKTRHPHMADKLDSCHCGEDYCIDGFVHRCAEDENGECQLYRSDWLCNG